MIAWVFLLLRRQTDNKAIAGHRDLAVVVVVVVVCVWNKASGMLGKSWMEWGPQDQWACVWCRCFCFL